MANILQKNENLLVPQKTGLCSTDYIDCRDRHHSRMLPNEHFRVLFQILSSRRTLLSSILKHGDLWLSLSWVFASTPAVLKERGSESKKSSRHFRIAGFGISHLCGI